MRVTNKARAAALLVGLALVAAACGGNKTTKPNASVAPEGKKGGTLKLQGAGDVDHLDTAQAYYTVSYSILRGLARQLVSYPTTTDTKLRDIPVGDAATTESSYADAAGTTYTFKIRPDVKWDDTSTPPMRAVTAQDFIVGLKRLCIPGHNSGGLIYYTNTIVGFTEFCDGFNKPDKTKAGVDVAAVKAYIDSHAISGITTPSDDTLVIKLKAPAGDFLNIMAMPFASAVAPEVALKYEGDSTGYRKNFTSNGPYKLAEYTADKSIKLVRNPGWVASSDPLRKAYVDEIAVTEGSDEEPTQQAIEVGTVDLAWDTGVPTPQIAALKKDPVKGPNGTDPRLYINPDGCVSYMVFNTKKPPLDKPAVRQALEYAADKAAIVQAYGGPDLQTPTGNVLTPPISVGYKKIDLYPTTGNKGDPAKTKSLLAAAGFPNGLTLTYLYRTAGKHPAYAQIHQAAFAKAGVTLKLKGVAPAQFYTQNLSKLNSGTWDLAQPGWCPDWPGNGARSFFSPLLDGRGLADGTTNYGQYNSAAVNSGIDAAIAASDLTKAADLWAALDKQVMTDAIWIPIMTGNVLNYRSDRVRNWVYFPFSHQADFTNVWLEQ